MDKQVQYVRITTAREYAWYDCLKGVIFPVEECKEAKERYCIAGVTAEEFDTYPTIRKSDCEVVPHPSQQPKNGEITKETEKVAANYAKDKFSNSDKQRIAYRGFLDGAKHQAAQSEGVGEGQHLITTEQLQELYRALAEDYITKESLQVVLRSWFPSVFAPAKTYKTGDRIQIGVASETYMISAVGEKLIALIHTKLGLHWNGIAHVENTSSISEQEMKNIVGTDNFQKVE